MRTSEEIWMGHTPSGSRELLRIQRAGARILILGEGSRGTAGLLAVSSKDSGLNPVVLDLGGHLSRTLSGHFETFDYRAFLYDACRLSEPRSWHSQLAAGAYSAALSLSAEEEAIVCAALQQAALQDEMANPVSIYNVMGAVEGFRGFYVDKLKGRIGSLRLFDSVEDQPVSRLAEGPAMLDFSRAPYPLAAELAEALILAKALALEHSGSSRSGLVIGTEAHRLFRSQPRPTHSGLLLVQLLSSSMSLAFCSDQPFSLSDALVESFRLKLYSCEAWRSAGPSRPPLVPGSLAAEDVRSGSTSVFYPRPTPVKTAAYVKGKDVPFASPDLSRGILEAVERFPLCTDESVAQYLAPDFLQGDVRAEAARLQRRGCILIEPKESGGVRVLAFTLTEEGRNLLKELRR